MAVVRGDLVDDDIHALARALGTPSARSREPAILVVGRFVASVGL